MKSIFALIILTVSTFSFGGTKYICKEITKNSWDNKKTMILTQIGHSSIEESVKYPFLLEVFESGNSRPVLSEKVTVETEDVMFGFSNKAKKISGMIYLDELEETYLTIGKKEIRFNCN